MTRQTTAAIKHGTVFQLTQDQPLRLEQAKDHCVICLSGRVWITAYNESVDFELYTGDLFVVPNDGLALIDAIGEGRIRIDHARRPGKSNHLPTMAALLQRIRTRFSMPRDAVTSSK
jgi:hypothetical protein